MGPRPLQRPAVDPAESAVFGRPSGVEGAFAATGPTLNTLRQAPPTTEALASAFGRPEGQRDTLQRPPGHGSNAPDDEDPMWSGDQNPWRDPGAGAVIGPPALDRDDDAAAKAAPGDRGRQLSLPEVLFGRRVKPSALVVLGVVALLIGAAGGIGGWLLARGGDSLTRDVTLAEAQPGKERPPGSVADIAARVRPAVVSIEVKLERGGGGFGSGVVIDGAGYIATNWHVVTLEGRADETARITALFTDGTRAEATIVGTDPKTDLAVIKVDVDNPTVLQFGNSDELQVGDAVIAIGSPLGLTDTVTEGIVSALHRPVVAGGDNGTAPITYDAIQTDAAVNQGNSGGPLVDSTGALVGINSAIRSSAGNTGSVGLGFAIPSNDARRITEALIRDGRVAHADLGANVRSVSADTAEGAQVVNVTEGGAAHSAGIVEGDVIRKVGDRQVRTAAELTVAVRANRPGDTVPVVLARQGQELTIQVTLGSD
ncbi:serine protease [Actinokineospora fastidiosa]|uniref:Serine protease n=1 Tax=Actinokineospora fastidiosa TaxID=1816 RepID=A0A918G224_9PSEU|nr:serine protease [Actinokineospora fastidiosa]